MGWYDLLADLLKQLPIPAVIIFLALIFLTDKNGIIQRIHRVRSDDRTRLSEDQRQLLDRVTADAERERNWRIDDADKYRKQLAEKDETIRLLTETAYLSERGNSRLRHGLNNMLLYVSALRGQILRASLTPYPFSGWHDLLNISKDLDENLNRLFGPTTTNNQTHDSDPKSTC